MTDTRKRLIAFCLLTAAWTLSTGCAVPQPRGKGDYKRVTEPRTGAIYHLYLPVDYVKNDGKHPNNPEVRKWPLVMTFHGMKPYDNARPQEREWEKEADTYGFVVCAPQLNTSDSFMEYPLTKEWSYVRKDRENVIAIMDHVFATTKADPNHVLSTSWSCGGYLAHYFPNRFPHRFSCIATRLSNFSAKLLTEETVPQYKDKTSIGIFIGDGDLPACKTESEEAVAWYMARNFKVVEGRMIDKMGHRRIPQVAAAFFAKQVGIKPLHPEDAAKTIARVHMTEYVPNSTMLARMSPGGAGSTVVASATSNRNVEPDRDIRNQRLPASDTRSVNAETSRNNRRSSRRPRVNVTTEPPPRSANPQDKPVSRFSLSRENDDDRRANRQTSAANATRIASADRPRDNNVFSPVSRQNPTPRTSPRRTSTPARRTVTTPPPTAPRNTTTSRRTEPSSSEIRRPRVNIDDNDRIANRLSNNGRTTPRRTSTSESSSRSTPVEPRTSRARNVDINITGPTIGPAPYFLTYSVNLPPDVVEGADFLWKDNGVWMDDRSTGVKVIETPGVHRITVLMITKNNVEYRGMATIRVLAEERTSRADD